MCLHILNQQTNVFVLFQKFLQVQILQKQLSSLVVQDTADTGSKGDQLLLHWQIQRLDCTQRNQYLCWVAVRVNGKGITL